MKFRIPKINKVLALLSTIALGWQSASVHALDTAVAELAINNGISTLAAKQNTSEGSWGSVDGLDYVYTAAAVGISNRCVCRWICRRRYSCCYGRSWLRNSSFGDYTRSSN